MDEFVPYLFVGSKRRKTSGDMGRRGRVDKRKDFLTTLAMIQSRLSSKAQTTIPRAVRTALRLVEGDQLTHQIDGDRVILTSADEGFVGNFSTFTEWGEEADCRAYGDF